MNAPRQPHLPDADSKALMQRIGCGDDEAFAELALHFQQPLLNFFTRMGVYPDETEDLVQECLLRVYRNRKRYRPIARFTTWLYTVARSVHNDRLRKLLRRNRFLERYREDAEQVVRPGVPGGDRVDVQAALDQLPEKMRSVVVLCVYQGLAYAEIAQILGIPEGTVKSRMHSALRRLRGELEK